MSINNDTNFPKRKKYESNRDEILQKQNTKNYKDKRNKQLRIRRKTDNKFCLVSSYRARLAEVLHKQKKNNYIHYLSCKREFFLDWIEFQLNDNNNNFKWEEYGKEWVIDHTIPVAFFDFSKDKHKYMCFSWFNLCPLTIKENREKSDKIVIKDVLTHQQTINVFLERYQTSVEIYEWLRNELGHGKNPPELDNPQPSS